MSSPAAGVPTRTLWRRRGWRAVSALAALGVAFGAPPAVADWLVLHDGSKIETAGPWRVRGKVVVFSLPSGGQLTSLRLSDVDLAASDEATAAALTAAAAPKPEPPPPRKAKIVMTDADIPRGTVPVTSLEEGGAEAGGREDTPPGETGDGGSDLVVLSWERVESPTGDGLQIYGTLQNQGRQTVTNVGMQVLLYGADGRLIERRDAEITRTELPTDAQTNFSVSFAGVFDFAAAKFEPRYRTFEPRRTPTGDVEPRAPSG